MTTAQLVTLVRSRLGEDTAASSQVTDAQIVDFLNASQMELCSSGNILTACATLDLTSGVQDYEVPSDFHKIHAIYLYRTTGTLARTRLRPIGILQRDPTKAAGDPLAYYLWGANDSVSGLHVYYVGLDPIPNYTTSDKPLEIFYRRSPSLMVSGGTGPEVDLPWQRALVEGALKQIYGRWANGEPQYVQLMAIAAADWKAWINKAEEHIPTQILGEPIPAMDTMGYTL
jgi:hypothetical protein